MMTKHTDDDEPIFVTNRDLYQLVLAIKATQDKMLGGLVFLSILVSAGMLKVFTGKPEIAAAAKAAAEHFAK